MKDRNESRRGSHFSGDAATLAAELRREIRGEVRFDAGSRALYATDSSNYREVPIGVVIPKSVDDIVTTVAVANRFGAPILARGCGTSLAGQCCNVAVVIDTSKYFNEFLCIDAEKRLATARPGIVLDDFRARAKPHQLTFGPDPATHNRCTIGGMIGNNSCGVHSVMAQFAGTGARTSDNLESLEILTYDGLRMRVGKTSEEELASIVRQNDPRAEIYRKLKALRDKYAALIRERYPKIPRRVSGYNLDDLLPENGFHVARALAGSEGTCVTILEATLQLIAEPKARSLLVLGYHDVFAAGDHCPEIMAHQPIGLEGFDDEMVGFMKKHDVHADDLKLLPEGRGWLLVEFGGESKAEADERGRDLMNALQKKSGAPTTKLYDNAEQEAKLWEVRESALGATAFAPNEPDRWPGWEDSAVPPERIGDYLRDLKALFSRHDYDGSVYGHFGQGLVHCRLPFDFGSSRGREKFRAFLDDAADLVLSYGGSLSGEHGDGQARAALLPKMFGEELVQAFREFKSIWDPQWKMNPGKVVRPNSPAAELRLGENYNPAAATTHFQFPNDRGSFARAAIRCVGVGKCRREAGGTMCPSYMVTGEEKDSTRGRARLLWEMLEGEVIGKNGWRDEHVKDALDLCLACKGCKSDCPVNVDMATYKAEFLSHYYKGRLRPIHAYAFGLIHVWSRLAQIAPSLVNFVNRAPFISRLTKAIIGVAPQRRLPAFAPESFKSWFVRTRSVVAGGGEPGGFKNGRAARAGGNVPDDNRKQRVMLWPDTFNNYFHPATAKAAVAVLEDAGFQIVLPQQDLCCGRPLYDYGMLETARRWLGQILNSLGEELEAGTPIVGLEPSCTAVFRDEVYEMFPEDENARRLKKQTFTLAEFLVKHAPNYRVPKLHRIALLHGHCHQKAVMGLDCERTLLDTIGLDFDVPDSGCCGMAGAFGFEAEHYEVSIACGERVLLPEVRKAGKDTLILADGFSCREQVRQTTDRVPLHVAEVLKMALDQGPRGPAGNFPESGYIQPDPAIPSKGKTLGLLALSAVVIGGLVGALLGGCGRRRDRKA
jgi:FAD/FMN-containing dehydrogenase/Fe-S oxidoreductase